MKRFVNGVETELDPSFEVIALSDRLAVRVPGQPTRTALAVRQGDAVLISYQGQQYRVETRAPGRRASHAEGKGELFALLPGQVVDVLAKAGEPVKKGQRVLVVEAMKTQQPYLAPFDGVVAEVRVAAGQQVAEGDLLARVEEG